ncbi:hypothetical protein GZH46_01698 [Fragariocoptes setiger]|uniref:Transducer of regulated CREB activity N-terminal domain-containing protein n=1 Tax=Fragariocoptes setiger TaxID=1670756 RepID=A0ABQ7S8L7_9ACAR|nr:hypothetical protein GZH46_01698 [Fragariocoptes setiger]
MPKSMTNVKNNNHHSHGRHSPRKFSEKIALLNQKEAEGNAAFEQILNEINTTCYLSLPKKVLSNSHQELKSVQYQQPDQQEYMRPKSCDVPNINVSRVEDDPDNVCAYVPITSSTKSLPDLSDLRYTDVGFVHSGNPTNNQPRFLQQTSQAQQNGRIEYPDACQSYTDSTSNLHPPAVNDESLSYDCNYDSPGYVDTLPTSNGHCHYNDSSVESSNSSSYKFQAYATPRSNSASYENDTNHGGAVTNSHHISTTKNNVNISTTQTPMKSSNDSSSNSNYVNRYNFLAQPTLHHHQPLARSGSANNATSWSSYTGNPSSGPATSLVNPYESNASAGPIPITRSNSHNSITYYQQHQSVFQQQTSFSHQCSPTHLSGTVLSRPQVRVSCDNNFSGTSGNNGLWLQQHPRLSRQPSSHEQHIAHEALETFPSGHSSMNHTDQTMSVVEPISPAVPLQDAIDTTDIPNIVLTEDDLQGDGKFELQLGMPDDLNTDHIDHNVLYDSFDVEGLRISNDICDSSTGT